MQTLLCHSFDIPAHLGFKRRVYLGQSKDLVDGKGKLLLMTFFACHEDGEDRLEKPRTHAQEPYEWQLLQSRFAKGAVLGVIGVIAPPLVADETVRPGGIFVRPSLAFSPVDSHNRQGSLEESGLANPSLPIDQGDSDPFELKRLKVVTAQGISSIVTPYSEPSERRGPQSLIVGVRQHRPSLAPHVFTVGLNPL
ncbi:hypothetical protein GCM10025788_07260 [Serinicoccus chungangensis]